MFSSTAWACYNTQCLAPEGIISPLVASAQTPVVVDTETYSSESATVVPKATVPSPSPEVKTLELERASKVEEIDDYIDTIFGKKQGRIVRAVMRVECNPANKAWPACQYKTDRENSVGVLQINIKSTYAKVHYDRIPGESLEEKVEWLKDPKNNVLMAYWIYSKSGMNPWAGYTSERYLAHLD